MNSFLQITDIHHVPVRTILLKFSENAEIVKNGAKTPRPDVIFHTESHRCHWTDPGMVNTSQCMYTDLVHCDVVRICLFYRSEA